MRSRSHYSSAEFVTFRETDIPNVRSKSIVARQLASLFEDGQTVGAGSGTTSFLALHELAARVQAGELHRVTLIPTSTEVELTCARLNLATTTLLARHPDWAFDGADEVNADGDLIKGRGGAMLREKLVLAAAATRRIVIDPSKHVAALGERVAVPVEVIPEGVSVALAGLEDLEATETSIRTGSGKDGPVFTEHGNLIVDCRFPAIASGLEQAIKAIPGVVESGLFQGYAPEVLTVS